MSKYLVLLGFIFLSGCLVRTYTLTKPRVDTEVQGNRGYLSGTPPPESPSTTKLSDTRKISVMEVELGSHPRSRAVEKTQQSTPALEAPREPAVSRQTQPQEIGEVQEEKVYQEYVVELGDTLQKISQKFYGTTKKSQAIYEENKDILKSANKVYPGTKLRIPQEKQ